MCNTPMRLKRTGAKKVARNVNKKVPTPWVPTRTLNHSLPTHPLHTPSQVPNPTVNKHQEGKAKRVSLHDKAPRTPKSNTFSNTIRPQEGKAKRVSLHDKAPRTPKPITFPDTIRPQEGKAKRVSLHDKAPRTPKPITFSDTTRPQEGKAKRVSLHDKAPSTHACFVSRQGPKNAKADYIFSARAPRATNFPRTSRQGRRNNRLHLHASRTRKDKNKVFKTVRELRKRKADCVFR